MYKILLLTAGLWAFIQGQDRTIHDLSLEGIDYASTLQYKKAVAVFDRIIEREPDNPQGHFLKSAVYFWMFSADMHNEQLGEEFKDLSLKAVEVAERSLHKVQAKMQDLELEVKSLTEKIAHQEKMLYGGKSLNPKEAANLQGEIASLKRWRSKREELLLEAMVEAEEAEERFNQTQAELSRVQAAWAPAFRGRRA